MLEPGQSRRFLPRCRWSPRRPGRSERLQAAAGPVAGGARDRSWRLLFLLPTPAPPADAGATNGGIEVAFAPSLPQPPTPPAPQPVKAEPPPPPPPPPPPQPPPPPPPVEPPRRRRRSSRRRPLPRRRSSSPNRCRCRRRPSPRCHRHAGRWSAASSGRCNGWSLRYAQSLQRHHPHQRCPACPDWRRTPASRRCCRRRRLPHPARQRRSARVTRRCSASGSTATSAIPKRPRARRRGARRTCASGSSATDGSSSSPWSKAPVMPDLDPGLEEMMRGATLPPFPADMPQSRISVSVTIRFSLEH